MKKTLVLLLAFALCLGLLTGCGKPKDREPEAETAGSGETYAASFRSIAIPEDSWVQAFALDDGSLLLALHEKLSEGEIPEGAVPVYEGQFDVYGTRLYRVGEDGTLIPLAFELPEKEASGEERPGESASRSLTGLLVLPGGELLALEQDWRSWYAGPAGKTEADEDYWDYMRYESAYRLLRLDAQGQLLSEAALVLPPESEEIVLDLSRAVLDGAGRLCVCGETSVFVFDAAGESAVCIEGDDWISELVALPDGRVLAAAYGMQGMELREVDPDKRGFGARFALKDYPTRIFPGGGDWDLFYTAGTWLCGYSLADERSERLFDLLGCDVLAEDLELLAAGEDGALQALSRAHSVTQGEALELVTLRRAPGGSVPQRTVLTLGALNTDAFSREVLAFNRSQEQIRIELRDYSALVGDADDYEAAMTRLTTEILSGSMPDLLALEGLSYRQLAAKGLLEDLYPYIDADPGLRREDLFESVLKSMELGGGLYEVSSSFSLITLMGASSVVGDTPGWTYDELNEALGKMPEGCTVLGPYTGRDEMLSMCVVLEMDRLVDWETGNCRFDSEDFVRLLEFVNSFPDEVDYGAGDGSENTMTRIASGKQLLYEVSVYDLDELCYSEQIFGGEATYIGFPTSEGIGNLLYANGGLAMSSRCADKDAAWQFLRRFLSADAQSDYGGLPINKTRMDALLAEAMKVEYERDENGSYKLDPETGERIPMPKGGMGMAAEGEAPMQFTLWPMTERQRDKLLSLINDSTRGVDINQTIYGIVRDEAEAYFAGQKSAEEVARLIQSKVSLYVNEQR